jgi:hypothetical protein
MIDAFTLGIVGPVAVGATPVDVVWGPKFQTRISPSSEPEISRSSESCKLVTAETDEARK